MNRFYKILATAPEDVLNISRLNISGDKQVSMTHNAEKTRIFVEVKDGTVGLRGAVETTREEKISYLGESNGTGYRDRSVL